MKPLKQHWRLDKGSDHAVAPMRFDVTLEGVYRDRKNFLIRSNFMVFSLVKVWSEEPVSAVDPKLYKFYY